MDPDARVKKEQLFYNNAGTNAVATAPFRTVDFQQGDKDMSDEKPSGMLALPNIDIPQHFFEECSFGDYINKVLAQPRLVRTAHERFYDMFAHYGYDMIRRPWGKEAIARYKIWDDPFTTDHVNAIYGIEENLHELVGTFRAAAYGFGQDKRIVLLTGPVGTAKSTAGELFAAGLEQYSTTNDGAYYSIVWVVGEDSDGIVSRDKGAMILGTIDETNLYRLESPMHEQPFRMLPTSPSMNIRSEILKSLNGELAKKYATMNEMQKREFLQIPDGEQVAEHFLRVKSKACPRSAQIFIKLLAEYKGDWRKVLENHLRVKRTLMSREHRVGIAITRPKSEKDQDSSEWNGDTNYKALGKFGSATDPRTFEFNGYFEAAEGGMLYSEEFLKLTQTFLYDYLGAAQEHRIQPKGFNEVDTDIVIIGGTNIPEYEKLKNTKEMEALRDRIIKRNVVYVSSFKDEEKIYKKFFNPGMMRGKHMHSFGPTVAAFWAVLTRLVEPGNSGISLSDKAKLYAGMSVEEHSFETVAELIKEAIKANGNGDCFEGVSSRFIIDCISQAFTHLFTSTDVKENSCLTPFVILNEIDASIDNHPHLQNEEQKKKAREKLDMARQMLNELVVNLLEEVISGDEVGLQKLHKKYINNLMAILSGRKPIDPDTKREVPPDENFMAEIERFAGKTDRGTRETFRTKISQVIAERAINRQNDPSIPEFTWNSDDVLARAYKQYLFARQAKDIDWQAVASNADAGASANQVASLRNTLVKEKGCCSVCAGAFLRHGGSIFTHRQNAKKKAN